MIVFMWFNWPLALRRFAGGLRTTLALANPVSSQPHTASLASGGEANSRNALISNLPLDRDPDPAG